MDAENHPGKSSFGTTRWTVVLQAKGDDAMATKAALQRREALGKLIETYWKPLYFYLRRKGRSNTDAEDLTQSFFATFLEKDFLKSVDRERGRFRSFILVAMDHFLSNEYDKAKAQKRGGQRKILSLDFDDAERRYVAEPVSTETPERLYMRKWSRTLTDQAMAALEDEFRSKDKAALFTAIKPHLAGGEDYAELADSLGITVANLKVTVHRARNRYREVLREAVRDTVATDAEVDAELWELIRAL
jgi:RNA polymerase sigma factor (sigma-70 family)